MYREYAADKTVAFTLPENARPAKLVSQNVYLADDSAEAAVILNPNGNAEIMSLAHYSVFDPAPDRELIVLNGLEISIE